MRGRTDWNRDYMERQNRKSEPEIVYKNDVESRIRACILISSLNSKGIKKLWRSNRVLADPLESEKYRDLELKIINEFKKERGLIDSSKPRNKAVTELQVHDDKKDVIKIDPELEDFREKIYKRVWEENLNLKEAQELLRQYKESKQNKESKQQKELKQKRPQKQVEKAKEVNTGPDPQVLENIKRKRKEIQKRNQEYLIIKESNENWNNTPGTFANKIDNNWLNNSRVKANNFERIIKTESKQKHYNVSEK